MEYIDMEMLYHHLRTVHGGAEHGDMPLDVERLDDYTELVEGLQKNLRMWCDEGPFKKGLAYLITRADDAFLWELFRYPQTYDPDEARAIMDFIWRRLYPDEPPPTAPPEGVRLIALGTTVDAWWEARGLFVQTRGGETFRSIAEAHGIGLFKLTECNSRPASEFSVDEPMPAGRFIRLRHVGECYPRDQHGLTADDLRRLGVEPPRDGYSGSE